MISEATLRSLERKAVDTVLSDDEAIRLIDEVRDLKRMLLNKKALGRQRTGLVVRNLLAVKPGEMLVFEKGEISWGTVRTLAWEINRKRRRGPKLRVTNNRKTGKLIAYRL